MLIRKENVFRKIVLFYPLVIYAIETNAGCVATPSTKYYITNANLILVKCIPFI